MDHPLLGGPDVPVECDGTTPMTYQKSGKGHPAVFKGCIVISATDRKYLRLALRSKASRGSESYENLRCVPDWLDDDSILWFGNNYLKKFVNKSLFGQFWKKYILQFSIMKKSILLPLKLTNKRLLRKIQNL